MSLLEEWSKEGLWENPKYRYCRNFPDLTPSPELSYMLGVRYGDLGVEFWHSRLMVNDKDFAEEFARCAEVVMRREYELRPVNNGKRVDVQIHSKILSDFLKLPLLDAHSEWIEPDYPAEFIRGFMDSEAHANQYPYISIGYTNIEVLYYISSLLELYFDINSNITTPPSSIKAIGTIRYMRGEPVVSKKVRHFLHIYGLDNVEKFYWKIDFAIARKSEVLEHGLYGVPHPRWRSKHYGSEE